MKLAYGLILIGFLQSFACEFIDQQVQALVEVKMMLNDSRGVLNGWSESLDTACGTIAIVMCGEQGEVIAISLSSSGLSGVLSPSIAKLTTLQWLFLNDNNITGGIPQEIGNLSSLTTLKLENNQFNGSISDSLGRLSELMNLDLSQNLLSGNISISLSNIPSLNSINLAYNNLSGEIPEQLLHVSIYNYTGNHLNCGPNLMSCEGNINNIGGSRKSNIMVVLGSIDGALALLLVLLVAMCVLDLRRTPCRHDLFFDGPGEHTQTQSLNLGQIQQFSFQDLVSATGNFSEESFLGQGSFSKVYKGVLPGPDNKPVDVKRLFKVHNHGDDMAFKIEAEVICMAVHRNILGLIGYCMTPTERLLVYPFMENLSLSSHLEGLKSNEPTLDWARRMKIVLGTACGLEYLHHYCNPTIIHRDIKAANVLLDGNFEAVLDFGLAKMMDQGKEIVPTKIQGTRGYIAPEYMRTGKASKKTDIYGYGVLVLEIVTGKGPDFHALPEGRSNVERLMQEGKLKEIVDRNLNSVYEHKELEKLINISLLCTHMEADHRPTMSEIVKSLEGDVPKVRWDELLLAARDRHKKQQNIVLGSNDSQKIQECDDLSWQMNSTSSSSKCSL